MTPAQHHTDPCPATHLPWLLSKGPNGSPSHQENASVLSSQLDAEGRMGSEKPPLTPGPWNIEYPRIGHHSSRQSHSDVASPQLPCCGHRRQEVQPPAATQELSQQQPCGEAAAGCPPAQGHAAHWFICEEGSTAPPVPSALPLLMSQDGARLSSLLEVRELLLGLTYKPNPV